MASSATEPNARVRTLNDLLRRHRLGGQVVLTPGVLALGLDLLLLIDDACCALRLAETSFKADMIRRRVTMTTETAASGGVGLGRGGRMSRQRKRDAVLRLLRGEDLEILSRALGVTAATLTGWRDTFVAAGEASLATRSTDGEALE